MKESIDIFEEEWLICRNCKTEFNQVRDDSGRKCPSCKSTTEFKYVKGFLRGRYPDLKVDEFSRSPTYNLCTLEEYDKLESSKKKEKLASKKYYEVGQKKERLREKKKVVKVVSEADKHTVSEAIEKYKKDLLPYLSLSEQTNVEHQLIFWDKKFGSKKLSAFQTEAGIKEILDARDSLASPKRGNSTLNRYLAAFSRVWTAAGKNFLWGITNNPCNRIIAKPEKGFRLRYLSKEEIKKLLECCETHHLKDAIELSIHTGGRKMEVWTLKFSQINFETNTITFINTKNNKPRSVPMNETIRNIITRRRKEIELQSSYIFPASEGRIKDDTKRFIDKPTSFEKTWRNAKEAAGLNKPHPDGDVVWHTLRHTFASWSVMSGISIKTLKELLGHEHLSQTNKYAHLAVPHLQAAMNLLDSELNSMSTESQINKQAQLTT